MVRWCHQAGSTSIDADPNGDGRFACAPPLRIHFDDSLLKLEAGHHGAILGIGQLLDRAKDSHERVTDELVHDPVVLEDDAHQLQN